MEIQIKTQPLKKQDFMDINHQTIMGKQPEGQKSSSWLKRQQEVADMRGRYGSAEQFLKLFTPDLQIATARNEARAYLGSAPFVGNTGRGLRLADRHRMALHHDRESELTSPESEKKCRSHGRETWLR